MRFLTIFRLMTMTIFFALAHQAIAVTSFAIQSGTVLPIARAVPAFTLVSSTNTFTEKGLQGHWSLLFFGFTHCQMICPTTMIAFKEMYATLEQQGVTSLPQVIFISVDPKRDTPSVVNRYVQAFDKRFLGLSGVVSQIDSLSNALGAVYLTVDPDKPNYTIDHSGTIFVINPKGELAAIFTMPHQGRLMAKDYSLLLKKFA